MSEYKYEDWYREMYRKSSLENIIIFRSGPMPENYIKYMDFDDNARALFEYALTVGVNESYKLVWIVKDPSEWEDDYRQYKNVIFISYEDADSDDVEKRNIFFRYLCLAKYIFMTDTYGFALGSREDQIRIMLWHGCGFKARLGNRRNENNYEYMTVTGEEYSRTYSRIFGLREDQMLITGYPKVDYIFKPVADWKIKMNIPDSGRYIFWLPTFRNTAVSGMERHNQTKPEGEIGLPIVRTYEQLKRINDELINSDTVLVVKLHPFQDRALISDLSDFSNIRLIENDDLHNNNINVNQILAYADALISDYSSVAVDYLVLDRPVAFTLDDVESYGSERGFFWPDVRPYLPGKELYSYEDFFEFILDVNSGKDPGVEKRHSICKDMQKYCDDKNSERVLRAVGII